MCKMFLQISFNYKAGVCQKTGVFSGKISIRRPGLKSYHVINIIPIDQNHYFLASAWYSHKLWFVNANKKITIWNLELYYPQTRYKRLLMWPKNCKGGNFYSEKKMVCLLFIDSIIVNSVFQLTGRRESIYCLTRAFFW